MIKKKILSAFLATVCTAAVGMGAYDDISEPVEVQAAYDFTYKGNLPVNGEEFTILCWTPDNIDKMLELWKADTGYTDEQINFVNFGVGSGEASALYDQYFLGGEDVDLFMVEPDWALKYLNDDSKTVSLSQLGFHDKDFANQYPYTLTMGKNSNGVQKAVSSIAAPGGWCYRADLAKLYLDVDTPEEMQKKISNWDKFQSTALEVRTASHGTTALTATIGGMWRAYYCNRTQPLVANDCLNSIFCLDFAKIAKNMYQNGLVVNVYQWTDDWKAIGQTNFTMGYFIPSWGFGESILFDAAGGENGETYGNWRVCQGPNPYYWGGTMMCVHPDTDNADMAASFINYFTVNEETMRKYADIESDYLVNNMNVMQNIVDEGTNHCGVLGGQDQFSVLHETAKKIDLNGLITPYDSTLDWIALDSVYNYAYDVTKSELECEMDLSERVAKYCIDLDIDVPGDVSGNGLVEINDAVLIAQNLIGKRKFTYDEKVRADSNKNGYVDIIDAINIAKFLLRKL